jgi:carbohydrate kinase (thermoresistant glucokinase family)
MVIIVMGVSGCGKTTVGNLLAERLALPFYDADDFHPVENVEKMQSGEPLNDADRHPWLAALSWEIEKWNQTDGAVLACSALKKTYRDILNPDKSDQVRFVFLKGSQKLILNRLKNREGHYMPPELLQSQLDALEEPENALDVSIEKSPDEIVDMIIKNLNL